MSQDDEILLVSERFTVVRRRYTTRGGKTVHRDTVQHPGAATILPLLDDGGVCLIRNHRVAVRQTLLELPAGTLGPGEEPAKAASRELAEETGYRAGRVEKLCEFFMSPGILNERMHLFLATQLEAGACALEECEEIDAVILPWDQAMAAVFDGSIQDAKTLVGLMYYDRLRRGGGD